MKTGHPNLYAKGVREHFILRNDSAFKLNEIPERSGHPWNKKIHQHIMS